MPGLPSSATLCWRPDQWPPAPARHLRITSLTCSTELTRSRPVWRAGYAAAIADVKAAEHALYDHLAGRAAIEERRWTVRGQHRTRATNSPTSSSRASRQSRPRSTGESADAWHSFLADLSDRGLASPLLVISDGPLLEPSRELQPRTVTTRQPDDHPETVSAIA